MAYIVLLAMFFLLNILSALSLVFIERKEPTTTWAWLIILIALPGIGFILYLLLGQNLSRQKIFREKKLADKIKRYKLKSNGDLPIHDSEINENYEDLILMNYNHSGAIYTTNNEVKIYTNGEDKFKDLFNDIREAKSFIHIEYYIFRYDELGKSLIKELREKVKDGVEVRFVIDGMGSKKITKKIIREIESYGIKISVFFPGVLPHINMRINYRNHRKIVVIDGKIGYVGGFNVGDEYLGKDKKFGYWRDTHIKFKGSAVKDLNLRFLADWRYATKEDVDLTQVLEVSDESIGEPNTGMQIVSSGPNLSDRCEIKLAYLKMIQKAKSYLYIQSPYLIIDKTVSDSLKLAAASGVDVKIMIPGKGDHPFVYWANLFNAGELLEYGIKIYHYDKTAFLHAKTVVIDDEICSIGTANMDIRSYELNFEVNAFIYSKGISKKQKAEFEKDMLKCEELTLEKYKNRGRVVRIKESISRLFSDVL